VSSADRDGSAPDCPQYCPQRLELRHGIELRKVARSACFKLVGAPRFELGTPCTPCISCCTAAHAPVKTPDFDAALHTRIDGFQFIALSTASICSICSMCIRCWSGRRAACLFCAHSQRASPGGREIGADDLDVARSLLSGSPDGIQAVYVAFLSGGSTESFFAQLHISIERKISLTYPASAGTFDISRIVGVGHDGR
jgi:hypothetical protein